MNRKSYSYLNAETLDFTRVRKTEYFVDKTDLIQLLNEGIENDQRFVCISRPRRFGKSVAADMLCAYYAQGRDSSALFDGLKISQDPSYRKHLNSYNVIFVNMTDEYNDEDCDVEKMIGSITKSIVEELQAAYPKLQLRDPLKLRKVLQDAFALTQIPFVIVIDEWDCILRENRNDEQGIKSYLEWLKLLFKGKNYLEFVYMTGILPIKKYGSNSALNVFSEYSMVAPKKFAPFIGFTKDEVLELCGKYSVDAALMKQWYDGYSFKDEPHVFNPNSVVKAILEKDFSSYWTKTETYEVLKHYIDYDLDGLRHDVVRLLAGESVKVKVNNFKNDMVTFSSKHDVLTLLIHLGYLSLDLDSKEISQQNELMVRIPNQEIRDEFFSTIEEDHHYTAIHGLLSDTEELLSSIWEQEADKVAEILDKAHSDDTSILNYNDENSLSCVVALAMHLSLNYYKVHRELPAGKGFADMVYLPREGVQKPALLIELKYDKSADSAIRQVHEKRYTDFFKEYRGEVLLVGINYDKTTKRHDCLIEKFVR